MPSLFEPYFEDFFVRSSDTYHVRAIELDILSLIATESSPGWPLLHRAILMVNVPSSQTQDRKMSVVEWALQLPDRREQVKGARAEVTYESSMKGGEIGNSTEICF
jgi:hypothetical protein